MLGQLIGNNSPPRFHQRQSDARQRLTWTVMQVGGVMSGRVGERGDKLAGIGPGRLSSGDPKLTRGGVRDRKLVSDQIPESCISSLRSHTLLHHARALTCANDPDVQ